MTTAQELTKVRTIGAAPDSLLSQQLLAMGLDPVIRYFSPSNRLIWNLAGPTAPVPGAEEGMTISELSGMDAPFSLVDLQGAREDGVTNLDRVMEAAELDWVCELSAEPGAATRRVMRWWTETWAGNRVGRLNYWTPEMGDWWMWLRKHKPINKRFQASYSQTGALTLPWSARGDKAFWISYDSVSTYVSGVTATPYCPVVQRGTETSFVRFLVYGPADQFIMGDGTTGRTVKFGPVYDGQVFLISTEPRLPAVIDVTPTDVVVPPQKLDEAQKLLQYIINFVTNNNVPPLLSELESIFGIKPPQGNPLGLMTSRFTAGIRGLEETENPFTTQIPVSIVNGVSGKSKIVAALTPMRTWPE